MSAVAVAGLGYVGLPLAMQAAEAGHLVAGYDPDERRVKLLAAGESYIEDVPAERLAAGRFRPSADPAVCQGFDVALITVPTPLRDGLPDLAHVEAAARTPVHPRANGNCARRACRQGCGSSRPPVAWTSWRWRTRPPWCSPTPAGCRRRRPCWARRA